jgi:hypothetical protein
VHERGLDIGQPALVIAGQMQAEVVGVDRGASKSDRAMASAIGVGTPRT